MGTRSQTTTSSSFDPATPTWGGSIGAVLGAELQSARLRAGLTEDDAARSCGYSVKQYRDLESGKRAMRVTSAERIAELPWVGPSLGAQIVETVRAEAARRSARWGEIAGSPDLT